MERYEHTIVEWYWTVPNGTEAALFKPTFAVFHADGQSEAHEGGNVELAALFNRLGQSGWRVSTAITASNWILYTLERKLA
jgi:hypothetical protein